MAAASRFDRSGATFGSSFSIAAGFSSTNGFSVGVAFALGAGFSLCALAVDDGFSGLFALFDGFSLADVFGFDATFPFADAEPLFDAVDLGDDFVRSFATAVVALAESATAFDAVSGFTAGAHAQAMTIAISGIRA